MILAKPAATAAEAKHTAVRFISFSILLVSNSGRLRSRKSKVHDDRTGNTGFRLADRNESVGSGMSRVFASAVSGRNSCNLSRSTRRK
jgi:hypothetical protein